MWWTKQGAAPDLHTYLTFDLLIAAAGITSEQKMEVWVERLV